MAVEVNVTEIPEHLLARSRAKRAGGDAAAASPAVAADAAPAVKADAAPAVAKAAVAAKPKPAKVDSPEVAFEKARPKIPIWANAMLVSLPIWAIVYAFTLDPATPKELGPLAAGAEIYSGKCGTCHGATGGGAGSNPKLADGAVLETFASPADQVRWVFLGSDRFKAEVGSTYGDTNKTIKGGMPSWSSLTAAELMEVVLHERHTLSGEAFDMAAWEGVADTVAEIAPDRVDEFKAVLEEWKATPPTG